MKTCPYCKMDIPDGASICPYCQKEQPVEASRGDNIAVSIICGIGAIGCAIWAYFDESDSDIRTFLLIIGGAFLFFTVAITIYTIYHWND